MSDRNLIAAVEAATSAIRDVRTSLGYAGPGAGSADLNARAVVEAVAPLIAPTPKERAVLTAAGIWHVARHSETSSMTFHHACKALSDAAADLFGELDRDPIAPPTEAELERGLEIVRRALAYSDGLRARGTSAAPSTTDRPRKAPAGCED